MTLSKRAVVAAGELRQQFRWLQEGDTTDLVTDSSGTTWWWTFAGTDANVELGQLLGPLAPVTTTSGLAIRLADDVGRDTLLEALQTKAPAVLPPPGDLADAWKFADALPERLTGRLYDVRQRDPLTVAHTVQTSLETHQLRVVGPRA